MTGKVILDEYADREPDYWITDMAPNGTFVKVAEVVNIDLKTRVSLSNLVTTKKLEAAMLSNLHRNSFATKIVVILFLFS